VYVCRSIAEILPFGLNFNKTFSDEDLKASGVSLMDESAPHHSHPNRADYKLDPNHRFISELKTMEIKRRTATNTTTSSNSSSPKLFATSSVDDMRRKKGTHVSHDLCHIDAMRLLLAQYSENNDKISPEVYNWLAASRWSAPYHRQHFGALVSNTP
jgi:hypothetical protein